MILESTPASDKRPKPRRLITAAQQVLCYPSMMSVAALFGYAVSGFGHLLFHTAQAVKRLKQACLLTY